jgi:cytochrome c oxidase assembly protein subunit 15
MHLVSVSNDRAVARWLLICAAMVFIIVVIGGITRLTESGLSITEWKPVSGVLPPLNAEQWEAEFARYRTTTEYQQLNSGMPIADFKRIFFWEYLHRLWGRLVGLVFAIPFFLFLARGQLRSPMRPRLWAILLLIGAQGALGWYMVASGLSGRTDVSQYRLVAHLSLALVIYVMLLWSAMELLHTRSPSASIPPRQTGTEGRESSPSATAALDGPIALPDESAGRAWAVVLFVLVSLTIVSGAFVAGTNAGKIYNTFPLMGGSWVPPS